MSVYCERMNPANVDDPLTFSVAPPSDQKTFTDPVKHLNISETDPACLLNYAYMYFDRTILTQGILTSLFSPHPAGLKSHISRSFSSDGVCSVAMAIALRSPGVALRS